MSPPTLYNLALKSAHQTLLKMTNLESVAADLAYKKEIRPLDFIFVAYNSTKPDDALKKIKKCIWNIDYLPFRLKVKTITAVAGFYLDLRQFAIDIANGLDKPLKCNLKYCISNVIINDEGRIDLRDTIINVTKLSLFKIEFRPMFLAHNGVHKSNFIKIYKGVTDQLKNVSIIRKRKCKEKRNNGDRIERITIYLRSMIDPLYYWSQERHLWRHDYSYNFRFASDLQYISVTGSFDTMKYFISKATDKDEKYLMETAEFAFSNNVFSIDKVVFFYKNIDYDTWKVLLRKYFIDIFTSLLNCWVYRDLCIEAYKEVIDLVDVDMFKEILHDICDLINRCPFEYQDVAFVIQSIWEYTPDNIKLSDDKEIYDIIIPQIVCFQNDFELLIHFIVNYNCGIQQDIIAHVLIYLVVTNQEYLVDKCLDLTKQIGITFNRDAITLDQIRKFLICDAQISRNSYLCLDGLTKIFDKETIEKFKVNLFKDNTFIFEFLSVMVNEKHLYTILNWALNDKIDEFKNNLTLSLLINDIYDRRLIENKTFETADVIFTLLEYKKEELRKVRRRVKENTDVIKMLMAKIIEGGEIDQLPEFFNLFFFSKAESVKLLKSFLLSSDGINAILDMFVNLDNIETCPTLQMYGTDVMKNYLDFINIWVKPWGLAEALDNKLNEIGEENVLKRKIRVKNLTNLDSSQEEYAKKCVSACYKGFKVLLNRDLTVIDLYLMHNYSLIEISQQLISL